MANLFKEILGGVEIAAGAVSEILSPGNMQGIELIAAGTATLVSGVTQRKPLTGTDGAVNKNPIAPWKIVYGRAGTGGHIEYGDLA